MKELLRAGARRRLPYRWKRVFGWVLSNSQSMRWMTQGIELGRMWRGRVGGGMRCLDVGCGGGSYAIEQFLGRGATAVLSDHSEELVRLARDQVRDAGFEGSAHYVVCDALALPFADGVFDRIQSLEVLEHIDEPARVLAEMRRVGRAGSVELVLSVPHPPEWFPNPGHVVEGYTADELKRLLGAAGWSVRRVRLCMLLLTRLVSVAVVFARVPLPMNFLLRVESWVPSGLRRWLLPYDLIVRAQRADRVGDQRPAALSVGATG